jgi:hypothetical protein
MFLDLLKIQNERESPNFRKELPIDVFELREAVQFWFRLIQKTHSKE